MSTASLHYVERAFYRDGVTALLSTIVSSAERTFDHHGFAATGMDRLRDAAGVSTRTLYKHAGNKSHLMVAVLADRAERFFAALPTGGVDALFAGLAQWIADDGSRGCLFLRAQGETGGEDPEVAAAVASYRGRLREVIRSVVADDLGRDDERIATQVLILVEGATSAASYIGVEAVHGARDAASVLMSAAADPADPARKA